MQRSGGGAVFGEISVNSRRPLIPVVRRQLSEAPKRCMTDADDLPAGNSPRYLSLVRFRFDSVPNEYHGKYPFVDGRTYVFFGEIPNMPGHCVVADHQTGQLHSGYHTENFIELTDDET